MRETMLGAEIRRIKKNSCMEKDKVKGFVTVCRVFLYVSKIAAFFLQEVQFDHFFSPLCKDKIENTPLPSLFIYQQLF